MNKEEYQIIQEGRSADGAYREMSHWVVTFFEKYFEYIEGPILEIGCGNGPVLEFLKDKGFNVVGMDISRPSIWHCLNHEKPVAAICQDAQEPFPFPDNSFKTVLAFHVLEHAEEPEKITKEINRVLNGNFGGITPLTEEDDVPYGHFAKFNGINGFLSLFSNYEIIKTEEVHHGFLLIANNEKVS